MLIILVRFTAPAIVGQYVIAFAICAPVIMFTNMRLRLLLTADSQQEYSFSDYMKVRLLSSLIAFFFIVTTSFIFFGHDQYFIVISLVAFAKSIESISDIYYALFQKCRKISHIAISLLIKSTLSLTLFYFALYYTRDVVYACLSLPVSWLVLLLFYDQPMAWKLLNKNKSDLFSLTSLMPKDQKKIHSGYITLIQTAIVLAPTALVGSMFANVTRYMIGATLGDAQLGIYAAIAYIGVAGQVVAASLVQPIMPDLAASYQDGNYTAFYKNYRYLLAVALFLGVGGCGFVVLFGDMFLLTVYGSEYSDRSSVFLLAMISASIAYFVLYQWYVLTAMKQLNSQLVLSVLTLLLLISFSFFWTPIYGIRGAIGAEILALSCHVLLGLYIIRKMVSDKVKNGIVEHARMPGHTHLIGDK